jgi:hypothetical protein
MATLGSTVTTGAWPPLRLADWKPTLETLHRYTQIAGKIRLALAPPLNHWWHVTMYVSPRGLTTGAIPYGEGSFEILFDFVDHDFVVTCSNGPRKKLPLLVRRSVADFYSDTMALLHVLGIDVHIWPRPSEIANDALPLDADELHATYEPEAVERFFRVLGHVDRILKTFASRFQGKQSPVHFFWGGFDLASTRFSGRRAPPRPEADRITREGYSHEVASFGFWPGSDGITDAALYSYAAPEPRGFDRAPIPAPARYDRALRLFALPYDEVRASDDPAKAIVGFYQAVYEAAATLGRWDRAALDREPVAVAVPDAELSTGAGEHPPAQPSP